MPRLAVWGNCTHFATRQGYETIKGENPGRWSFQVMMSCLQHVAVVLTLASALLLLAGTTQAHDFNVLLPSSSPQSRQWKSAMLLASSDAVSQGIVDSINLNFFEYQHDNSLAIQLALQSVQNASVLGCIGFGDDSILHDVSDILSFSKVTLVSPLLRLPSPNGDSLTQFSLMPNTVRTPEWLAQLFASKGWLRIGFIYIPTEDSMAGLSVLPTALSTLSLNYETQLQSLIKNSVNVIIVSAKNTTIVQAILTQAQTVGGLFIDGRAWIFLGADSQQVGAYAPEGTLFVTDLAAVPTTIDSFRTRVQSLDNSTYPEMGSAAALLDGSMQAYDAVMALAHAVDQSGMVTRANVFSQTKLLDFQGCTGRVTFNQTTGFRQQQALLVKNQVNMAIGAAGLVDVLLVQNSTITELTTIVYPGPTTDVPSTAIDIVPLAFINPLYPPASPLETRSTMAFLKYALHRANNWPGLLPPNTKLTIITFDDARKPVKAIQAAFPLPQYGVAGALGSLASGMSSSVQDILGPLGIPQFSSSSTSPFLSDKVQAPTFIRNCPSDNWQATTMISMSLHFQWTEIAVVSVGDAYGAGITSALLSLAPQSGITVLNNIVVNYAARPTGADFVYPHDVMQPLVDSGAKIVFLLGETDMVVPAIKTFKEMNYKPAALIGPDAALGSGNNSAIIKQFGITADDLVGFVKTTPTKGNGPVYDQFVQELPTLETQFPGLTDSVSRPFFPLGYIDAVHIYAEAMRKIVEAGTSPRNHSALLKQMYMTDLQLLTGRNRFDSKGDRIGPYDVMNYQGGSMTYVGKWFPETGYAPALPIVWRDGNTKVPTSSDPRIQHWFKWTHPAAIIFAILAIIGIFASVILFGFVIHQQDSPVIRSATYPLLLVMLFGLALGYGSILTWIGKPVPYICGLRIWLPPVAFILIIAPLLVKTWRLHKIFTLSSLKVQPILLSRLVVMAGVLIAVQIIICIFWISLGTVQTAIVPDKNDRTRAYVVCQNNKVSRICSYVTFAFLGSLMLIGSYLAFNVRNLPKDFNESRWIGFSTYNILLFSVLIIILGYSLSSFPVTVLILSCVCTLGITTGVMAFMMGPKFWLLFKHPEKRSGSQNTSGNKTSGLTSVALVSIHSPGNGSETDNGSTNGGKRHNYSRNPGKKNGSAKVSSQPVE